MVEQCCCHCIKIAPHSHPEKGDAGELANGHAESDMEPRARPWSGWKGAVFVLGNECCDRLISDGMSINLVTYLKGHYHMHQVASATTVILVTGTSNLASLLGAFVSDAYLGRFCTIIWGSGFKLLGALLFTVTALSSSLTPVNKPLSVHATNGQLAFLGFALCCTIISVGGMRPCSYAFGADQFKKDDKIKLQSYFNWYFFALYVGSLLGSTFIVYVQDNVSWAWGFGIPSIISGLAIIVLLFGIPLFKHFPPMGSPYPRFLYVMTAAMYKRKVPLPQDASDLYQGDDMVLTQGGSSQSKLSHTDHLKWLDHAAIKTEADFDSDMHLKSRFMLTSIQQVEELKCLLHLLPILLIDMLVTSVLADQSGGFYIWQAKTMDRHVFVHSAFQIPAASMIMFTSVTHVIWMPIYDKWVVPSLRKMTGNYRGITLLQRLGIGIFLSVMSLLVSGIVETKRRGIANTAVKTVAKVGGHEGMASSIIPLSVFWLAPELCLKGLSDAFRAVAQLEFLHNQLPASMHCVGGAIYWCSKGLGNYLGTIFLQLVHRFTATGTHHPRDDWLADNINHGHLDYFYYLLALLQMLFFFVFLIIAGRYTYKK